MNVSPMKIKIKNSSPNPLPKYASEMATGVDVQAHLEKTLLIEPMERTLIPTGLYLEMPADVECQVRPRSGLALKKGLTLLNSPGTIDADYRGEVKILLINLSQESQSIQAGDRIAQLVFSKFEKICWENTSSLSETQRDIGGFGSTGR